MEEPFARGDRITISQKGLANLHPQRPDRLGTVVGFGRNDCVRIRWDGTKTSTSYSCNYITKANSTSQTESPMSESKQMYPVLAYTIPYTVYLPLTVTPHTALPSSKKALKKFLLERVKDAIKINIEEDEDETMLGRLGTPKLIELVDWSDNK